METWKSIPCIAAVIAFVCVLGCGPTEKDVRASGVMISTMFERGQFGQAERALDAWKLKLEKNPELTGVWIETMAPIMLNNGMTELNMISALAKAKNIERLKTGDWSRVGTKASAARIAAIQKIAPSP